MQNYYGPMYPNNGYQMNGYPAMNANPQMQQAQQIQPTQQIQQTQQMQNGGFLAAPNEDYVLNYPVAPGNCLTFKIEGKPIVMEKSMGFSQLESPKVERYRLMKEEASQPMETEPKDKVDIKSLIDNINKANDEIEAIWVEIDRLKNVKDKKTKRDRDGDDRYDE